MEGLGREALAPLASYFHSGLSGSGGSGGRVAVGGKALTRRKGLGEKSPMGGPTAPLGRGSVYQQHQPYLEAWKNAEPTRTHCPRPCLSYSPKACCAPRGWCRAALAGV